MQAALVPIYQKQHGAPVPIHIFRGNLKKYSSSYQLLIFRILLTDRPHQLTKPVIPGKNIRQINHSLSEGLFDCSVLHICSSWASVVFVLGMGKHNIRRRIGWPADLFLRP